MTRYSLSGLVKFSKYHPGKFLVAWHPKASEENERTTIVIENKTFGEVLYRQIAGALARRIVNYAQEGNASNSGDGCWIYKIWFKSRCLFAFRNPGKCCVKSKSNWRKNNYCYKRIMIEKNLDTRFLEAVEIASKMTQASLPQDVQLRLYAFYKQATFGALDLNQTSSFHLRDAFKTNAWMQISHLTPDESKEQYIEMIHFLVKNNNKL